MNTILILVLVIAAVCGITGELIRINAKTDEKTSYEGPAKLIAELTDDEGGFICEFEKDGKKINAIYGGDSTGLKVGDVVQVVWRGWYYHVPQVMYKEDYDKDKS